MRVVLATGGSGGHLFPAIKVAEEIKRLGHEVHFIGSFRVGKDKLFKAGFSFDDLKVQGFSLTNPVKFLAALSGMVQETINCRRRLKELHAEKIIGFGGYGSFPAVMAAIFLRLPTMIHEQNVIPGKANRLLGKFVGKVAVSFEEGRAFFDSHKIILTGCPCLAEEPSESGANYEKLKLKKGLKTILVLGGSQGSRKINQIVIKSLQALKDDQGIQVIHSCGANDFEELQKAYQNLSVPFALFKFIDNMSEVYTIADLVISRAGAVTVTEIAYFSLPAILIPYPHAHGHQRANAAVLEKSGPAVIIDEADLTPGLLKKEILKNLRSDLKSADNYKGLKALAVHAARNLSTEIVQLN